MVSSFSLAIVCSGLALSGALQRPALIMPAAAMPSALIATLPLQCPIGSPPCTCIPWHSIDGELEFSPSSSMGYGGPEASAGPGGPHGPKHFPEDRIDSSGTSNQKSHALAQADGGTVTVSTGSSTSATIRAVPMAPLPPAVVPNSANSDPLGADEGLINCFRFPFGPDGGCGTDNPGEAEAGVNSIDLSISLGGSIDYGRGGYLRIFAHTDAGSIVHQWGPSLLAPPNEFPDQEIVYQDIELYGGYDTKWIRQIVTPEAFVEVDYGDKLDDLRNSTTDWDGNFAIKFYPPDAYSTPTVTEDSGEYFEVDVYPLVSGATPFKTWTFTNTFDPNETEFEFKATDGVDTYTWTHTTVGEDDWTFEHSSGGSVVQKIVQAIDDPDPFVADTRVETKQYYDGTAEERTDERVFTYLENVRVLESMTTDVDGLDETTSWTYQQKGEVGDANTPTTLWTRVKSVTYPDGRLQWYDYDDDGRLTAEMLPWRDTVPTAPAEANTPAPAATDTNGLRTVRYEYVTDAADWRPRKRQEYVNGTLVAKTVWDISGAFIYERDYPDPAGSTYAETIFEYESSNSNRIKMIVYPNGLGASYTYETGSYDPNGAVFDDTGGGSYLLRTTTRGEYDDTGGTIDPIANKSTKTETILDPAGNVVFTRELVATSGADEQLWSEQRILDDLGRVTQIIRSDGTTESRTWGSSCCSPNTTTNRYGQQTTTVVDPLGRVTSHTQEGAPAHGSLAAEDDIVTTTTYSIAENYDPDSTGPIPAQTVRVATTTVTGGSTSLTTYRRYDMAGRILAETDAAGLVTTYLYESRSPAGEKTTITYPGGATRITETYADGRVKSVTGTAVVETHYDYSVTAGEQTTSVTTGPVADDRTRETTVDGIGRVIETRSPGYDATTPGDLVTTNTYYAYTEAAGTAGQLKSSETVFGSTPIQNQTLYEYDEVGNLYRWGIDGDGDNEGELKVGCFGCGEGGADITAVDRITDEVTEYEEDSSGWLRKTTRTQYRKMGGTIVPSVEKQRLSGFATGVVAETISEDIYGNPTTVTTTLDTTKMLVTRTTSFTATDEEIVSVTRNGRALTTTDRAGLETSYEYDSLGRTKKVIDSRGNATETSYDSDGRVAWTKDGGGNQTSYEYDPATGRLEATKNPDNKYTRYAYSDRGEIEYTWGHVPQPVRMQYNDHGERTHLHTYRDEAHVTNGWEDSSGWPGGSVSSDVTQWEYDDTTGLLLTKTYADSKTTTYTYTPDGKLLTRSWARLVDSANLKTTYAYDATYGDMTSITYSDAGSSTVTPTPPVTMTYLLTGAIDTVTDAAGKRTFKYDSYLRPKWETFTANGGTPALYGTNSRLSTSYIDEVEYFEFLGGVWTQKSADFDRLTRIAFGTTSDDDATYEALYTYDPDTTRMDTVEGPGLHNDGVRYVYDDPATSGDPGSNLVTAIEYVKNAAVEAKREFSYRPKRNLLKHTAMIWDPTGAPVTKSKYTYRYDSLGRRTDVVYDGTAFSQVEHDAWTYNARNELTASERFDDEPNDSGASQATLDREYEYDPIGNRLEYTEGTSSTLYYCTNELNQYEETGDDAQCTTSAETFEYDLDGNLTLDGDFTYEWDAENRLIAVLTRSPSTSDDKKLTFGYDYRNRRVWKKVFDWDPNAGTSGDWEDDPSVHRKFVWHNWLMIAELDGSDDSVIRRYTWGLDLPGQHGVSVNSLEAAGGVGGLLAIEDEKFDTSTKRYLACYDGNGNVTQMLLRSDGSTQASYMYGGFGQVASATGTYAAENPMQVSTKYAEASSGLLYWGARYFSIQQSRWICRDPIQENGGLALYGYVSNNATNAIDPLGFASCGINGRNSLSTGGPRLAPFSIPGFGPAAKPAAETACYWLLVLNGVPPSAAASFCCTVTNGPPAPGMTWGWAPGCRQVAAPAAPAPAPAPPPPARPWTPWCGNSDRATGRDIQWADDYADLMCPLLMLGCQDLKGCIIQVEGERGSKDDLCQCLADAMQNLKPGNPLPWPKRGLPG